MRMGEKDKSSGIGEPVVDETAVAVERLSAVAAEHSPHTSLLKQICHHVLSSVPGTDIVAVTMVDSSGRTSTVAATDPLAFSVDAEQYIVGQGPSLDSAKLRIVVRANRLECVERWPQFARRSSPVNSFLSAPIVTDDGVSATLNLYSYDNHGFHSFDEAELHIYSVSIETIVHCVQSTSHLERELELLRDMLESRAAVGQAIGILMATEKVSAAEASDILDRRSRDQHIDVGDIAESIVAAVTRP